MKPRDYEYLAKLQDFYAQHRMLPSYSVMAKLVGLRSTSAAATMAKRLREAGYLDSAPGGKLQPGPQFFERNIADSIRAGLPEDAFDNPMTAYSIDEYLVETPSKTVLLNVKGDSMADAGILDGDIIVVQKGAPAKDGNIVAALVDGEYTVKYLANDAEGFYLKPANNQYPDIRPNEFLEIFGLVVGSFRRYS